ncbi:3D domain-containing protein [Gracilibacillus timonensis]|uniref:3D domain-containing protein n=1 Tax=Gracilibacillus timonensis TaxID=1816696 RepID=UPI0008240F37|nr:3D domain-containing protein [Gracilibacillus timonensis]
MKKVLMSMGVVATSFCIALPISAAEYEVEQGDNLWSIADENNTSVAELKDLNQLDSTIIHPNQILQIDKEEIHVVEKGETLGEIAKEHGVKVKDLKDWNNLDSHIIQIGQELTIEESNKEAAPSTEPKQEQPQQETAEEPQQEEPQQEPVEQEQPKEEEVTAEPTSAPAEEQTAETPSTESDSSQQSGETINVTATAYTGQCDGCSGITATGIDLNANPNEKVIAVDPNVIPLGSRVHVEGYGEAIAGDTGGAINGNKIDVHVPTKDEAYSWGVRSVEVTILD